MSSPSRTPIPVHDAPATDPFFDLATDLLGVFGYDGSVRRLNAAWDGALGWTQEELFARGIRTLLHPEDEPGGGERQTTWRAGIGPVRWEARYLAKDGSYRSLQFSATPFAAEEVVYTVARDVTDQKLAADALRTSQAQMARLAESGIIGICVADTEGKVFEANPAYCDVLGCTQEELLAGTVRWAEAIAPEYAGVINASRDLVIKQGFAPPFEVEIVRRDGSRKPVLCGVAILEYPKCIAFTTDLTERKRAEESLKRSEHLLRHAQKMEAIGQLAAGIAHEMNTPAQYVADNIVFLRRALDGAVAALGNTARIVQAANGEALAKEQVAEIADGLRGAKVDF